MAQSVLPARITTPRLTLVHATAEIVRADVKDRPALVDLLGATVPENWPPELLADHLQQFLEQLERGEPLVPWYWLLHTDTGGLPVLIGNGGFFGHPSTHDAIEVGYSVLPQYHNCGYATEAVGAMVEWAFAHEPIRQVIAHTFPNHLASIRVLEKNRFQFAGEGNEPGTIEYVLLRERFVA